MIIVYYCVGWCILNKNLLNEVEKFKWVVSIIFLVILGVLLFGGFGLVVWVVVVVVVVEFLVFILVVGFGLWLVVDFGLIVVLYNFVMFE